MLGGGDVAGLGTDLGSDVFYNNDNCWEFVALLFSHQQEGVALELLVQLRRDVLAVGVGLHVQLHVVLVHLGCGF